MKPSVLSTLILFAAAPLLASRPQPELPDYWPACASPQRIGPRMPIGGAGVSGATTLAWTGKEFGAAYFDYGSLYFRRLFADGTPAGNAVMLAVVNMSGALRPPRLLWNGAGYAVAWHGYDSGLGQTQVYFALLNGAGGFVAGPTRISFFGQTPTQASENPALAHEPGGRYLVTWQDWRNSGTSGADIYRALLDSSGSMIGPDAAYNTATGHDLYPTLAWPAGGDRFLLYWINSSNGTLVRGSVDRFGTPVGINGAVMFGSGSPDKPAVVANDAGAAIVWGDYSGADAEIRFARLNQLGDFLGTQPFVTNDSLHSYTPVLVWTGVEYGLAWYNNDSTTGHEVMFQRLSDTGAMLGGPLMIFKSDSSDMQVGAAFARSGYGITIRGGGANGFLALGCSTDSSPPTCPANFNAYNITGTSATVNWLPSEDLETDFAYYQVYQNNAPIARTSDNFYNASGLALNSTYNFAVRPVNAAQLSNSACSASIYVRTNSTLTLTMNKATAADAGLDWSDAGFNNYNIFRGNSPQVMQQIGATPELSSTDPNVLTSPISYFYSVDNPGS